MARNFLRRRWKVLMDQGYVCNRHVFILVNQLIQHLARISGRWYLLGDCSALPKQSKASRINSGIVWDHCSYLLDWIWEVIEVVTVEVKAIHVDSCRSILGDYAELAICNCGSRFVHRQLKSSGLADFGCEIKCDDLWDRRVGSLDGAKDVAIDAPGDACYIIIVLRLEEIAACLNSISDWSYLTGCWLLVSISCIFVLISYLDIVAHRKLEIGDRAAGKLVRSLWVKESCRRSSWPKLYWDRLGLACGIKDDPTFTIRVGSCQS